MGEQIKPVTELDIQYQAMLNHQVGFIGNMALNMLLAKTNGHPMSKWEWSCYQKFMAALEAHADFITHFYVGLASDLAETIPEARMARIGPGPEVSVDLATTITTDLVESDEEEDDKTCPV